MIPPRRYFVIAAVLSALVAVSTPAYAHQQKESYTSVLFNQRTEKVEVSHRFSIHDAEHVLKELLHVAGDLSGNSTSQKRFANYIEKRFSISNGNHNTFKLASVGHEVDKKYFWVYQEMPIPDAKKLSLVHTALFEVWPTQINYINVEKDGWVRSARLTKEDSRQEISLI